MKRDAIIAAVIAALVPWLPIWEIDAVEAATMALITWGMSFVILVGTEGNENDKR